MIMTSTRRHFTEAGILVDVYDCVNAYCRDLLPNSYDRCVVSGRIWSGVHSTVAILNVGDYISDRYIAIWQKILPSGRGSYELIDAAEYVRSVARGYIFLRKMYTPDTVGRANVLFADAYMAKVASMAAENAIRSKAKSPKRKG